MATRTVNFKVSTQLAALLGETYRSTEAALKELVDNAWDADALTVKVTLPAPMTSDPIVVSDDGHGMTPEDVESEYLDIARNRRSTKGELSPRLKRRIKGRKGIGKFAGLAAARRMVIDSVHAGIRTVVDIDKEILLAARNDIERIPLPLEEVAAPDAATGTSITLSELDPALNFPNPDELRALLYYEYGRASGFTIFVNGTPLDVEDMPGETIRMTSELPDAGEVSLRFTIAKGKTPKHAGFVLRVGGKVVGKPQWFGLDSNPDIPDRLRKRLYGEIEVDGMDGVVTSDWGAIIENSKAFAAIKSHVNSEATKALNSTRAQEMHLHRARLGQENARKACQAT